MLPGHGPALADVAAVARVYLAHRRARLAQVEAAVAAGADTPEKVVDVVYPDIDPGVRFAARVVGRGPAGLSASQSGIRNTGRRVGSAVTCPVCGTVAVPGARFCHNCGAALPAAATLPAAERRIVTVLFGDLSDFTSWSEDLDPERVGAVTDRVLAALAGAVKTFGGHVDKLTGDGIMAVFGAPVAHEDDAERAVRAALTMQRAVRRVLDDERGGGAPLGLRVGLNTGEVVAGIQAVDRVHGHRRHGEHRRPAGRRGRGRRGLRRRAHQRRHPARRLLAAAAPAAAQGQARAGRGVRAARSARRAGHPVRPRRRGAVRRPGDRARPGRRPARRGDRLGHAAGAGDDRRGRASASPGSPARSSGSPPATTSAAAGTRRTPAPGCCSVRCRAFGERRRFAPLADLVRKAVGLPKDVAATVGRRSSRSGCASSPSGSAATATPPDLDLDRLLALLGYGEAPANPVGPAGSADWQPAAARRRRRRHLRTRWPTCSARWPPRRRWWSSWTTCTTPPRRPSTRSAVPCPGSTGPVVVLLLGRPELVRTAGALTRLADAEVHTLPPLRGADASRLLTSYLNGGKLPQPDTDRLLATAQGNPFYLAEMVTLLMERGALTPAVGANAAGTLAARRRLARQPAALPRPGRGARRPHRRAAGRAAGGAARRRRGRRHGADRGDRGAARAPGGRRRPARRGGRGRAGTRGRRAAAAPHAAPGARRVRVHHPADARGRVRRDRQGRPGRPARVPGHLGGAGVDRPGSATTAPTG